MPGHAASWCKGYPEVCPSTTCLQPLNVANQATFDLIESTLKECTGGVASKPKNPSPGVFKDNFIHLGGDEVDTSCWSSTPSVKAWLDKQNMTPDQGYAYFVKKVADMAIAQGTPNHGDCNIALLFQNGANFFFSCALCSKHVSNPE